MTIGTPIASCFRCREQDQQQTHSTHFNKNTREQTKITKQELEGQWTQLKGQLMEHWGVLTEDDLQKSRGNANQLVGVIQQKTGQTRREIELF